MEKAVVKLIGLTIMAGALYGPFALGAVFTKYTDPSWWQSPTMVLSCVFALIVFAVGGVILLDT